VRSQSISRRGLPIARAVPDEIVSRRVLRRYNDRVASADPNLTALTAHPSTPNDAVRNLGVRARAEKYDLLVFHFSLAADMSRLRVPPTGEGRPADSLWKHTCFEAFVAAADMPGYQEFNFAPSRDWAIYRFSAYREGMSRIETTVPEISVRRCDGGLELESALRLAHLPELRDARHLRIAMAAVIEDAAGGLSYWGLRHAPGKPDFHNPTGFTLEIARS
jgi:hypothetical protein